MEINHHQAYDLVKVLNEMNFKVIFIDNEYFAVDNFVPSDRNTPYHTLHGRHITKLIHDYTGIGINNRDAVSQKIDALPERDIQYSSDYSWKWMIN